MGFGGFGFSEFLFLDLREWRKAAFHPGYLAKGRGVARYLVIEVVSPLEIVIQLRGAGVLQGAECRCHRLRG